MLTSIFSDCPCLFRVILAVDSQSALVGVLHAQCRLKLLTDLPWQAELRDKLCISSCLVDLSKRGDARQLPLLLDQLLLLCLSYLMRGFAFKSEVK